MIRTRDDDACPGALQVHQAADGALARLRIPGGMISAAQLSALAEAADQYGNGTIELTARGNLQLRGVSDTEAVADAAATAGLLPSPSHERVRNIVASPLSGRVGGLADVRPWVTELDRGIQADPDLARLPGRFLFSVDDGSGDVSGLRADVGAHVLGEQVALLLAGSDTGVRLGADEVVNTLLEIARRFVAVRGKTWRVAELADATSLLAGYPVTEPPGACYPPTVRPPVGWIVQDDGRVALGAGVPLGGGLPGDRAAWRVLSPDGAPAGRLDRPGRRPGGAGGRCAAGGTDRPAGALPGRDRGTGGDHAVAFGSGVRSRRAGGRHLAAGARPDGFGIR
ncbi:hypothetical protein [Mycobacterium sp. M26]|uniref:hypothetical protein n=1 Tax=Mycobacterium sp. M26 TaxID=1762962 RepID=UPI0009E73F12|nr:hypothetical protein [Mycobacterium sp. M26]